MTFMMRFAFYVFILASFSACAVGNKYRYHDVTANLSAQGSTAITVATHDQRPYIVSGNKNPDFVGLQRGGYGNPFNVSTASGKPLDQDITQSIINSLNIRGFQATPLTVSFSDNSSTVLARLKESGRERLLLLTLHEWKSDTMTNVALIYDVQATVMDRAGNILGSRKIEGRDDLRGSFWNAPSYAKEAVPIAFREKLQELLNSPEIAAALY